MVSDVGSSNVDVKRSAGLGGIATAQSCGEPCASVAPAAVDPGGRDVGGTGTAQSGGVPGASEAAADLLTLVCFGSQGATFACNRLLQLHGSVLGAAVPLSELQLALLKARLRSEGSLHFGSSLGDSHFGGKTAGGVQ